VYGDADTATVSATSGGDAGVTSEVVLSTVSLGEPFSIPFTDAFLTTVIDIGRWIHHSGAEVNSVGLNEPSDPYSLNLDGSPSAGDTIFSQHIDLSGESSVIVRYYYERTGDGDSPEVGDNLFVDYLNNSGSWLNLETHLGDGPDMDQYEEVISSLPIDAYHSEFRLRLRSKGTSGSYDDWFIDDIYVGLPSSYDVRMSPSYQEQYGPAGDTVSFFVFVKNRGVLSDDYSLVDSASSWNVSFWDGLNVGQITKTGPIESGDSVEVLIKIEVPQGAPLNSADTAIVKAVSTSDPQISAEAMIVTTSAGVAASVPWFEPFASGSVDMSVWMMNVGGEIASNSYSPPSSPYALQLDGGNDTLVSQLIDLSSQAGALFTYHYERTGPGESPDGGDDLVFEYKNSSAVWVEMGRQLGSGSDMTSFEFVEIPLPGDAMHNSFQIRLTSSGSGEGSDDWYVDDLSVDFAPSVTVSPSSLMFLLESGESADAELLISNGGPGTLNYSVNNIPIFDKSGTFGRLLSLGQVEPARPSFAEGASDGYVDVKGSEDSREGRVVRYDAGGPDGYGYIWVDSDEPGGPQYDWIDVQSTGILVSDLLDSGSDDDYAGPFPIGFTFSYYGVAYTEFYISSNGFVGFGPPDRYDARTNTIVPTLETPNNILAWCWTDLNPVDANNPGAGIYYDSDDSRLVIQFVDLPQYSAQSGDVINAEVILYANGRIRYQYQDIALGFDVLSATVGIENSDGDDGLTVVFNGVYLKNSLAVEFASPAQWLTVSPSEGSVAPTESDTVSVHVVSTGLDDGDYVTQLHVNSNDPDPGENPWIVSVDLTVTRAPEYICGDADGSMEVDIDDAVFVVQYIFGGGPSPDPYESGDVDCSGGVDIDDAVFLIQYIFSGGNVPCDTDGDEVPDC
jgi:hypothetical protein